MTRRLPFFLTALGLIFSSHAQAKSFDEISLRSKFDRFVIKKNIDGFHYIGDQKVSLSPLKDFMILVTSEVEGNCSDFSEKRKNLKPDLTLKARIEDQSELGKDTVYNIDFFIPEKMVRKGDQCAPVSGDGIYYLPLHRSWFTGKSTLSVEPKNSITITKDGQALLEVDKPHGEWRNSSGGTGTNWDQFRNFLNSLKDFKVQARLHPAIGESKPSADLLLDGKLYKAFLVGKNLWALQFPKVKWLVSSADWAAWGNFSSSDWYDRFTPTLKKIADKTISVEMRTAAMQSLGNKWSRSIKRTFQAVLEDSNEPVALRVQAVKRLRKKPSDDNFIVFMAALDPDADPELLFQLTRALKIKNPGGPSIKPGTPKGEIENAIIVWKSWWDKFEKTINK